MFIYKKDNLKVPIKVWMNEKEYYSDIGMVEQVENTAQLPFAFHHVALSPDGHLGFGAPIGGILATKDVIVPNFVGKDIGCGMCAVKTSLTEIDTETLKKIMNEIRQTIPVGFKKHKEKQDENLMPKCSDDWHLFGEELPEISKNWDNALISLGTLGGGNHFIEIQKGSDGHIWIMIHSGSRNLGKQVADYYNKQAIFLNQKWHSSVPKEWELAFLPADSDIGKEYIREMQYCVDFALANRKLMMDRIIEIFIEYWALEGTSNEFSNEPMINIAHNYASLESHFKENVWVHRKGATLAREGTIGIIPGSQGTFSYIVEGLGNKESFESCSHGAGRKMGRKQAIRELDLKKEMATLEEKGVLHSLRGSEDLDEAPGSYKDIGEVMENQKDLIKIKVELEPLCVIKG